MPRELLDEVSLPHPCCFWSCKPLAEDSRDERSPSPPKTPSVAAQRQILFALALCFHGNSLGSTTAGRASAGDAPGNSMGCRDGRGARQGHCIRPRLLVGLPFKLRGNSTDFIIRLPNCCTSLVLAGFTAPCSPPAPTRRVSPLRVSFGHRGAVLTSRSQTKGSNAAASRRHGQTCWAGA